MSRNNIFLSEQFSQGTFMRDESLLEITRDFYTLFKDTIEGHKQAREVIDAISLARVALTALAYELEGPRLIDRIRIGLLPSQDVRIANHTLAQRGQPLKTHIALDSDDISNYWVEIFEFRNDTLYRVGDAVIKIHHYEYLSVLAEPSLYYFSTAFKLHCRLQKAGMGAHR